MKVLAIDPGNKTSGWVLMDGDRFVEGVSACPNKDLLQWLSGYRKLQLEPELVVCEWIQSYGMAVGKEVFHTCRWCGQFQYASLWKFQLVYRKDVKLHMCGQTRAKDANVRQAILDLYPATGGGARPQIGTKKQPGPLHGVSGHMWPALGLALTVQQSQVEEVL